ncbi:MAG: class I SAM-dependent methyltransferase [Deltaproteobacteria bacterium]|nr:class I SAM-dependent methyltransferase [Deltaproteobacteria bacterium]
MTSESAAVEHGILDAQQQHWDTTFSHRSEMFGEAPSDAAQKTVALFKQERKTTLLELGSGQGRDTLFFARNGFHVTAVDYAQVAIDALAAKAQAVGVAQLVTALRHDIRAPLPFPAYSFDGCYSHMLYCMALTTNELEQLSQEVWRVLRPGGLNIYTVRHTQDPDYGTGIHRGEDMYEVNGFIVHFFSREKVVQLARGYEIISINEFEEGKLPRKLFRVTLRKKGGS